MLVLVGVGLQEQLADIATTQVRNARLVPKYSAKVRRALGILQSSCPHEVAAPTRPLLWQRLAACKVWPSHICAKCAAARKSATQLTQMLRQRHPQRLQDFNLQICLLPNWIQIGFLATISN